MNRTLIWGQILLLGMMTAGCRSSAQVREVSRVDQQLTAGNRGYLIGTPPAVRSRAGRPRSELPSRSASRARRCCITTTKMDSD